MKKYKRHLVQLDKNILYKDRYANDNANIFYANIEHHRFIGYLLNFSSTALYFEPEDHNDLIIVPHAWVKWCVPIKEEKE